MLPYQDFFYAVDLPDRASPAEIRRACPSTVGRQVVFRRFYDAHPDDVRYLLGYLDAYTRNGVYDDQQYRHCYDLIAKGLALADRSGAHRKLHKLQRDLEQQHAAVLAECGPDPPADGESPGALFLAGRYDALLSQFTRLQKEVTPVGILGPPEEKDFWNLFQFAIRILFAKDRPGEALSLLHDFETERIAVALTPMPDLDIQEAALGYLAVSEGTKAAEARLLFWIQHSRMPIVSEVIREHPAFAQLVPRKDY